MEHARYPLFLDLTHRAVLVVGGGPVAARRTAGAVAAGGRVTVIAPVICEDLRALEVAGQISWEPREFLPADLEPGHPWWLVHTATGDRATDALVAELSEKRRIWCARADDAGASTAWVPAVTRDTDLGQAAAGSGGLTVAVSAAADPGRARAVRDAIAARLACGEFGLRRSAHRRAPQGASAAPVGKVALVGGGPGDPGLLTVRGRRLVAQADVIVADRLAPSVLLAELREAEAAGDVEVVDVGKSPGNHAVPQDEINRMLVEHARRGSLVVRLKGGDPFVLGRGAEEALYCAERGIAVEIVPGVTSALAVPAAAGIPVTQRGVAAIFTVASAHGAPGGAPTGVQRSDDPASSLVLLMGVGTLRETAAHLVGAGRDPGTPVAVIERGTLPDQRTTIGTLADIADQAAAVGVRNPAVIVVGEVVRVRADLAARGVEFP